VVAEAVELATILLTDLVGSTRLATSVGPVRADELREEHFVLLRQAIASGDGREVKNTGDGLMVAFGSASAAARCAVAMQQLFECRYARAEQGLHVERHEDGDSVKMRMSKRHKEGKHHRGVATPRPAAHRRPVRRACGQPHAHGSGERERFLHQGLRLGRCRRDAPV
jgi:hypothetical protein